MQIILVSLAIVSLWISCCSSCGAQRIGKPPQNDSDRAVLGIDISHHNHVIDWDTIAKTGEIKFAFTKATEGADFVDSTFDSHWRHLHRYGIAAGAYHFYRLDVSVDKNFDNVKRNLFDRVNFTADHMFAVDFEVNYSNRSAADAAKDLWQFLTMTENEIGFKPWIYTYALFWRDTIGKHYRDYRFGDYPLWIAHYGPSNPNIPLDTWPDYRIWQFTSSGRLDGFAGKIDVNLWKNPPPHLFDTRKPEKT